MKNKYNFLFYISIVLVTAVALFSTVITVSPAFAMRYGAELPIVKELIKFNEENNALKDKLEVNTDAIEEYKETMDYEDRNAAANLVLDFVRAQYSGDRETMYSLCTPEFAGMLKSEPYLAPSYGSDVELRLVIVSNVVMHEGKYLAFIRIEDSRMDSQYQENFFLDKVDDQFIIENIEQDV